MQYLVDEFKIGFCVGLRSVGAGVKGLVLGSTMFNGLAIVHDYGEQKVGYAMSTCAHDPVPPQPKNATGDDTLPNVWDGDPLHGGPDLLHSRPHVFQNRYFVNGTFNLSAQ